MRKTYRKLLEIMTPSERRRFWLLVVISFLLSFIEAASVLSILPFLHLLSNPELIETNAILSWLYASLGFASRDDFLVAAGVTVFVLTVVGLLTKIVAIWVTSRFALMRSYSFSMRLLTRYLHQPYEWFLTKHSADLGNAILGEVNQVVSNSLLPAMRIIPEAFTAILLIAGLCLLEPWIAISAAVLLGGTYSVIYLAVRSLMGRLGKVRLEAAEQRFHAVQEATGGLKELKVIGLEDAYLARFRSAAFRMAKVQTTGQILSQTPRYALEAIAFGGMILLILFLLVSRGGEIETLIPTLGVIAAAGLRLIPALQTLYQRFSTLRQGEASLDRIHNDLTELDSTGHESRKRLEAAPLQPLTRRLVMKDVRYAYPSSSRSALRGLNLEIKANTTIGIVGGTGAGKTTLVDIMLGLLDPAEGHMEVDDVVIGTDLKRAWQRTLGYVPQTIFLSDGSVAENIAFGVPKSEIDHAAVEHAARVAALHDFVVNEMPDGYETKVGERGVRLSGGQRQRVGIARALYNDPSTLIFDEATSALDTLTEQAVMDAVHNLSGSKTIVMIAHRLSTVRNCDKIFLLREGRVAASGSFEELVANDDQFRRMAASV